MYLLEKRIQRVRMISKLVNKVTGSIFARLLLVLIVTAICVNLMVGIFFGHVFKNRAQTPAQKNLVQYVQYLIHDMGHPPDIARAKELSRKLFLEIEYRSPDQNWSTTGTFTEINPAHYEIIQENPMIKTTGFHNGFIIDVINGDEHFRFQLTNRFQDEVSDNDKKKLVLVLLVFLTAVFLIAYGFIRRIIGPFKPLTHGVQQISRGNLEHKVILKGANEFKALASAFNHMTFRIKAMLTAKEQLLLDVSHELRSPITRMKMALEFLHNMDIKKSLAEDISEMEMMVTEILESARMRFTSRELKKNSFNMGQLVQEISSIYQNQPPGIKIHPVSDDIHVHGDPEKIKIVLNNLLRNAVKYSGAGSRPVEIKLKRDLQHVIVTVQDNGSGIPEEALPFVFEPFYRVDKSRSKKTGGYGLGLSLCKTIMDAHHASIKIESALGKGTLVRLRFIE